MYKYEEIKPKIFLEENQEAFIKMLYRINNLICTKELFTTNSALTGALGDSWLSLAFVHRLEELKIIRKIATGDCTQNDVYTKGDNYVM